MAAGQREGVAVGTKGLKAAEGTLRLRAFNKFPWLKVLTHNLAHNSSHNPAHGPAYSPACNPAHNPAKGGWAVWR